MLKGLKQLPLVSKIIFIISLIILFVWVIPTMVNYFKNVQVEEQQVSELQKNSSKYGISIDDTKKFDKESFIQDTLNNVSKASVESLDDKSHAIILEVDKDKIGNFNKYLETLSLRYLVKITSPITFKEKDKFIEVKMSIQEI
jgi:archaellum component FlaF (FlaF/FlaG flagellin family)